MLASGDDWRLESCDDHGDRQCHACRLPVPKHLAVGEVLHGPGPELGNDRASTEKHSPASFENKGLRTLSVDLYREPPGRQREFIKRHRLNHHLTPTIKPTVARIVGAASKSEHIILSI